MPPESLTGHDAFGDLLRRRRLEHSLTQAQLAERAGLSVRGLSDLERGARTRPQRETLQRLLQALPISDDERRDLLRAARAGAVTPSPVASQQPAPAAQPGAPVLRAPSTLAASRPDPLVGRAAELALLRDWLRRPAPGIVTLTGPGGAGKTSLALTAGHDPELAAHFRDGVTLVDLAPVREATLVMPAIAAALGLSLDPPWRATEALASSLLGQHRLLILDNCEQVIAAAVEIGALAAMAPATAIVATSREALGLRAERCLPVAPLALPGAVDPALDDVLLSPAVQVFRIRAEAVDPGFTISATNAAAVAALCRRLDGLPLALELAGALMAVTSPAALLAQLADQRPLPGLLRDLPPRQRTLHDTVVWSEALLAPAERALFHTLGVFAGDFTREQAARVWQAAQPPPQVDLDALLASLIRKHLLQRVADIDEELRDRYRMLETIRAHAAGYLAASPAAAAVHAALAHGMAQAAEAANLRRRDRAYDDRMRRLQRDLPNLRAALDWFARHEPEQALRLLDTLGSFWAVSGNGAEGLRRCEAALAHGAGPPALRGRVLRHAAWLATNLGEFPRAAALIADASALADANDAAEQAALGLVAGNIAHGQGDLATAEQRFSAALTAFAAQDDHWATLACLNALASIALDHGDVSGAADRYVSALRLAELHGGLRERATLLCNLAVTQRLQGDLDDAATTAAQALALAELAGALTAQAGALQVLGRVALARGDAASAREWLAQSLAHWRSSGDQRGLATVLEAVALAGAGQGAHREVATLLGAIAALRMRLNAPATATGHEEIATLEAQLRAELGPTPAAVAHERGRLLTLPDTLRLAQTLLPPAPG